MDVASVFHREIARGLPCRLLLDKFAVSFAVITSQLPLSSDSEGNTDRASAASTLERSVIRSVERSVITVTDISKHAFAEAEVEVGRAADAPAGELGQTEIADGLQADVPVRGLQASLWG